MQFSLLPQSTTNGQLIVLNHFGDQNQSVGTDHEVQALQGPRGDRPVDPDQLGADLLSRRSESPVIAAPGAYSQIAEPQQFVIASGTYCSRQPRPAQWFPLRFTSPLARNLNPGDGVYLRMTASHASTTPIVWTVSFATCVN